MFPVVKMAPILSHLLVVRPGSSQCGSFKLSADGMWNFGYAQHFFTATTLTQKSLNPSQSKLSC